MAEAMLAGDGERWRVEIYGVPYSKVLNLPQPDRVWRIKEGKRIVATRLLQADAHRIVADHNAALMSEVAGDSERWVVTDAAGGGWLVWNNYGVKAGVVYTRHEADHLAAILNAYVALTTPRERERELLEALREAAQHAHRSMHMNKVFYPDRTLVTDCPGALCRKWSDAIDAYEKRGAPK